MNGSGILYIGYDFIDGDDVPCLCIFEKNDEDINCMNTFYGEEAKHIFKKLMGEAE